MSATILPYRRDWSSALTKAQVAIRKTEEALNMRQFLIAADHNAEAQRQLQYVQAWINREGK